MDTQKKPRKYSTSLKVTKEMEGGKIGFDKNTGCVFVLDINGNAINTVGLIREHYYERDKKTKQLSRLVVGPKYPLRGLNDLDFLATYDLFYIIDTNKLITSDNKTHHITSFLECCIKDIGEVYQADVYERVGYFHFVNLNREDPEKVGWINLFKQDFFQNKINASLKIGIITDAYLGDLDFYNSRSIAITENHFLPNGVTLLYATADTKDTFVNNLLHASDQLANDYKRRFLNGEIKHISQDSPIFKCESYCFLNEVRVSFDKNIITKSDLIYSDDAAATIEIYCVDANGNETIETKTIDLGGR